MPRRFTPQSPSYVPDTLEVPCPVSLLELLEGPANHCSRFSPPGSCPAALGRFPSVHDPGLIPLPSQTKGLWLGPELWHCTQDFVMDLLERKDPSPAYHFFLSDHKTVPFLVMELSCLGRVLKFWSRRDFLTLTPSFLQANTVHEAVKSHPLQWEPHPLGTQMTAPQWY